MKKNQRTIKVYDSSHKIAARLSARFDISMAALVEILLIKAESLETLELPRRDPRSKRTNARKLLA